MTTFASGVVKAFHYAVLAVAASSLAPALAAMQHGPVERSAALTLTLGGVSRQLSPADLARMRQSTMTVHNIHSNRDEVYTGVAVADLLTAGGLPFTKDTQPMLLRSYIRAQGTDFYFVIYSGSEAEPDLTGSSMMVATRIDGHDLGNDGQFKLVSRSDRRPARWVRNLLSLTLVIIN